MRQLRTLMLSISIVGMILSGPLAAAQQQSNADEHQQQLTHHVGPEIYDVALRPEGIFLAKLLSANGQPLVGQQVTISQSGQRLLSVQSSGQGQIAVRQMQGGLYQIHFGNQASFVRVWTNGTAPPAAVSELLLIRCADVRRAQCAGDSCAGCELCDEGVVCDEGCGAFGDGPDPFCGIFGQEPIMLGLLIAAAIAIPIAVHNSDADNDDAS